MTAALSAIPGRARVALGLLLVALLAAPLVVGDYLLSVLILCLFMAYVGQAWNVMMGFAGQLSLGHSLYVGLGAYASAALFVHAGLGPWAGAPLAVVAATVAGGAVGWLGFRFGVRGVYFALLTIAFAEFTRILFDHIGWLGGSGGFFLPVSSRQGIDLANLRGGPLLFYYVILALVAAAAALSHGLLRTRLGYYWQAIREDQDAAAACGVDVFRCKMLATLLSAAMTSLAGVFFAFYFNNLFPSEIFSKARSIELILAPIIGGLGTVFGPIVGAFLLTPLGELTSWAIGIAGIQASGLKQVVYGLVLIGILVVRPAGVWPWLARRLGLDPVG